MNHYALILAGGGGSRLWPLSTEEEPKQFLRLGSENSLLQNTVNRLQGVIKREHIFIVTTEKLGKRVEEETAGLIGKGNILKEPCGRNTAPCIGWSAGEIMQKYGDGILTILPADAYIRDEERFRQILTEAAAQAAEADSIYTIGIRPDYPVTGYGYLQYDRETGEKGKRVLAFHEKPDEKTARAYLEEGNFLWNSGIFISRTAYLLQQFARHMPLLYEKLTELFQYEGEEREKRLRQIYPEMESVSIDYGLMEKVESIHVFPGDFGWNDMGSLDSLAVLAKEDEEGNVCIGEHICLEAENCISYSGGRTIALVGVEGLIVVETEKAVLVCHKDRVQEIKKVRSLYETGNNSKTEPLLQGKPLGRK